MRHPVDVQWLSFLSSSICLSCLVGNKIMNVLPWRTSDALRCYDSFYLITNKMTLWDRTYSLPLRPTHCSLHDQTLCEVDPTTVSVNQKHAMVANSYHGVMPCAQTFDRAEHVTTIVKPIIKCGAQLFGHSQMVAPLKFGNGYIMSSRTSLDMLVLIHAGIELNNC